MTSFQRQLSRYESQKKNHTNNTIIERSDLMGRNYPNSKAFDHQSADWEDTFEVASATECTGLVPAAPASRAEDRSYRQLYPQPLSVKKARRKKDPQ